MTGRRVAPRAPRGGWTTKIPKGSLRFFGAIAFMIAFVVVVSYVNRPDSTDEGRRPGPKPTPSVETTTTTTTVTVGPDLEEAEDLARQLQPLQELQPGDRVLYDAGDGRPLCVFKNWSGSIASSEIKCPGLPPLTVETGFLTSVEFLDPEQTGVDNPLSTNR